ncbi:uncharacterized protein JCM10292_003760 [Rhodotorula paludigena]|uniref:uncharacterized protein n=1 Tax=Rhodotorula paludigena TaxID=86838 RepID=UPI0031747411
MSTSSFIADDGTVFLTVFGEKAQTYTLDKSAGSFGMHDGLVPVTVLNVDGLSSCEAVQGAFDLWSKVDDVWRSEIFMSGLVLQSSDAMVTDSLASCFAGYNASFVAHKGATISAAFSALPMVASFFAENDIEVPQGPYMAEVSATGNRVRLSKVYRVYHDELQAFNSPAVPDASGDTFHQLSAEVEGMNTMSIPVPSRVYTLNVTTPRPLEGMRVGIKDIYDLKGFRTGCGNRAHWNLYEPAEQSAYTVQVLIDAGAAIVGKVKTSQFANGAAVSAGWFDQLAPFNPRGDGYQSPSTSSSGSAASIAGYPWLDFTIGSDTGGSIRFPAGACGLYSLRASWGALSLEGVMPMVGVLDAPGYFARSGGELAKFGKAWFADTLAARSYSGFPSKLRVPEDLFSAAGAARSLYTKFTADLASFLGASVDTTSYWGQWSDTVGRDVGVDLASYANTSWTTMVGYYQYKYFGAPFIQDYEEMHAGRTPAMDATVQVRWKYGTDLGEEGYNAALDVKAKVKEFADNYVTIASNETCSETLFVRPQSAGDTSYRTYFPSYPTPAWGYDSTYHAIYAEQPEITIPIGHFPYNSTVTNHVEYLPVTVSVNAARGCDYMLLDLAQQLHAAGIVSEVKTGPVAF